MLNRRAISTLLLACLLLVGSLGLPVFAGQIDGITVDVANFKDGYDGDRLVDGDTATAWVGGGKSVGPGKWIELTFPAPVKLQFLTIANGNQAKGNFNKFRRVTRGFIKYPDESRQQFTIKPTAGIQKIKLLPKTVDSLRIVILGVAPGTKDAAMGKAKVAVSEVSVFGEMDETAAAAEPEEEEEKIEDVTEKEPVVVEDKAPAPTPAPKPEPAAKPEKKEPVKKADPAPKPKAPAKAEVKPEPQKDAPEKAATKPKKIEKKPSSKKTAPKKAAPKKTKKVAAKPATSGSATAPGVAYLRSAVQVPESKPFDIGQIDPWLNLELVAQIKRYLGLMVMLHDSYPDVFIKSIRDRERKAFVTFQNEMRAEKKFGQHHMAQLDHIGLSFDKPVLTDEAATVRAHGPYRYYIGDNTYEFQVDAEFSFMVEDQKWLISGVKAN